MHLNKVASASNRLEVDYVRFGKLSAFEQALLFNHMTRLELLLCVRDNHDAVLSSLQKEIPAQITAGSQGSPIRAESIKTKRAQVELFISNKKPTDVVSTARNLSSKLDAEIDEQERICALLWKYMTELTVGERVEVQRAYVDLERVKTMVGFYDYIRDGEVLGDLLAQHMADKFIKACSKGPAIDPFDARRTYDALFAENSMFSMLDNLQADEVEYLRNDAFIHLLKDHEGNTNE